MMEIAQTTKGANSADYYFPYLFSFCPKNPSERLYVDPPTMLSSVFNQRKRFGKLDFGRYREFLVSLGVVADLKSRVDCWRNFRLTIFQKVLLQLKNSFKTRYVSDTIAVEPAFVGFSQDPQTHVHGVTSHFLRFP